MVLIQGKTKEETIILPQFFGKKNRKKAIKRKIKKLLQSSLRFLYGLSVSVVAQVTPQLFLRGYSYQTELLIYL